MSKKISFFLAMVLTVVSFQSFASSPYPDGLESMKTVTSDVAHMGLGNQEIAALEALQNSDLESVQSGDEVLEGMTIVVIGMAVGVYLIMSAY